MRLTTKRKVPAANRPTWELNVLVPYETKNGSTRATKAEVVIKSKNIKPPFATMHLRAASIG
jgi:hypothetical protein